MPRNVSKKKSTSTRNQTKMRSSVKPHETHRRPFLAQSGTATGRFAETIITDLARPVARHTGFPTSYVKTGNRTGFLDTAARLTGTALAVTSAVITAPFRFALQALMMSLDTVDLKSREYRDDAGRTHHHTRTFMRDHAGDLRVLAG